MYDVIQRGPILGFVVLALARGDIPSMIRALRSFLAAYTAANAIFTSATAQESAEITVLADQIRSQGYACSKPTAANLIAAESVPEEPVYVLKCEDATYRIRLVPDQAAKVTRIE